jgi:hypothetical protein
MLEPWNKIPARRQEKTMKKLETFFRDTFFAGGAGTDTPPMPPSIAVLGPTLVTMFHTLIPQEWKDYHFNRGFESRPAEEQAEIKKKIREAKEAAQYYAHLPTDGANYDLGNGETRHVPFEEMKTMVDKGLLPPNPEAKRIDVRPFLAPTEGGLIVKNPE